MRIGDFVNVWLQALTPSPSPTPTYNPSDVTQGPVGFFVIVGLMLLTGLIAISLMNRTSKLQARYQVREELEAEKARLDAGTAGEGAVPESAAQPESAHDTGVVSDDEPADEPGPDPRA